jgi:PKHD-type hydroxylase
MLTQVNGFEGYFSPVLGNAELEGNDDALAVVVVPRFLSHEDCARVIALGMAEPLERGLMETPVENYRVSDIRTIRSDGAEWLYLRLEELVRKVNARYQYRLRSFREGLQFTQYGVGGNIQWHVDSGRGTASTRKLSVSIQLTPGNDYDGGDLEIMPEGVPVFSRGQGAAIVFPSFLTHRVLPVTRGIRHSLVAWAHGPTFS